MNWTQLQAMLWLRWRLTRNQWRRGGQLNAVITLILLIARAGLGRGRRHCAACCGGAFGLSQALAAGDHAGVGRPGRRVPRSSGRSGSSPNCSGPRSST